MKNCHVIVNPNAGNGKGRKVQQQMEEYLRQRQVDCRYHFTEKTGDAETLARQLKPEEVGLLAVIGGDGTYNEVLNGMAIGEYPLALIPAGTGNDFCRMLGITDWKTAVETMLAGTPQMVDYGEVNQRFFLNFFSTGLDAAIANQANEWKGRYPGKVIYILSLIKQVLRLETYQYQLTWDDGAYQGPGQLLALCNGAYYGGGMKICPKASLVDGKLDLCLLKPMSRIKILTLFPTVFIGKHLRFKEILYCQTGRVTLTVQGQACAMNMDGEIHQEKQIEARVISGKLNLMMPGKSI